MARPVWSGYLRLSLVAIPVKAFTAHETAATPRLNQLHGAKGCHRRIRYQKACPEHGPVTDDEIVSGFEYTKDHYVTVEDEELKQVRQASDKTITIEAFIAPEELDPIYLRGKSYYLLPDGRVGDRPYALIERAMRDVGKYAFGQSVLFRREQLVLIRPKDGLLTMSPLSYADEIRPASTYAEELPHADVPAEELKLTKMLIEATTPKHFDLGKYHDPTDARLHDLVEAKVAGKKVVAPEAPAEAPVINLMDALKQSMSQLEKESPRTKSAPSSRTRGKGKGGRRRKAS